MSITSGASACSFGNATVKLELPAVVGSIGHEAVLNPIRARRLRRSDPCRMLGRWRQHSFVCAR